MNAIIDPADLPAGHRMHDEEYQSHAEAGTIFTLRRTGHKPVRFEGWQLIEATGTPGGSAVWHDLNIYQTAKGGVVVELIVRHRNAEHQDVSRVKTFENLDTAAAWLEAHRPADDVPIPASLAMAETGLPWAVLQAVQLRQCIERIEADFQALLSEVFAALELSDPAEV